MHFDKHPLAVLAAESARTRNLGVEGFTTRKKLMRSYESSQVEMNWIKIAILLTGSGVKRLGVVKPKQLVELLGSLAKLYVANKDGSLLGSVTECLNTIYEIGNES